MTKKFFALIAFVFITSSCSIYHVSSVDETEAYLPSKGSIDDVVYLEDLGDKDYTVIGIVTVNGERKQRSFDEIVYLMRREAAMIGGDAITDIKTDATGVWKKLPVQKTLKNAYVRANFTATAVIFGNPDDRDLLKMIPVPEGLNSEDLTPTSTTTSTAEDLTSEDLTTKEPDPLKPSSITPIPEGSK